MHHFDFFQCQSDANVILFCGLLKLLYELYMQIIRSSLHNMHAYPSSDFHICNRMRIAAGTFTMGHVTTCMHAASLDNCYHLNINLAHCLQQWAMLETLHADGIRLKIKIKDKRNPICSTLCNSKALGESACSISGLRMRSWMWDVAGTDGSSWYPVSTIENTLTSLSALWVSLSVRDATFSWTQSTATQPIWSYSI